MAERAPDGYAGKILRVNLSNNTTSVEKLDELLKAVSPGNELVLAQTGTE